MAKSLIDVLQEKIKTDIETRVTQLRGGTPQDFTSYKHLCGQIRGLEMAQEHIQRLLQTMEEHDE